MNKYQLPENISSTPPATILLVEDEDMSRKMIDLMLRQEDFDVICASNGKEGLELFLKHKPMIVLTDFNMPKMTGLEMIKEILEHDSDVKTLLMTAYTDTDVLMDAINIGVDKFIDKPINRKRLKNAVLELFSVIELKKEIDNYQKLLESYQYGVDSSTIFSIINPDSEYTYVNKNLCDISGYTEEELLGSKFTKYKILNEDYQLSMETNGNSHEVCKGFYNNQTKHGEIYQTETIFIPTYYGDHINGYICIEKDITNVISSHRKSIQELIDADPSIILAYNDLHDIAYRNKSFLDFFDFHGYTEDELSKVCFCDFLEEQDGFIFYDSSSIDNASEKLEKFLEVYRASELNNIILISPTDSNRKIYTISEYNLPVDFYGTDRLNFLRLYDITELERLKNEEMEGAMLASIGKLAAGITHEINTPLTYVQGNIEMLKTDIEMLAGEELRNEAESYFESIDDGINRMKSIIESMKEIIGTSKITTQETNLYSTIVVACRMIHNRAKHITKIYINDNEFNLDLDRNYELFMANIDSRHLEQLWIIILNNALDQLTISELPFSKRAIKINIETSKNNHKISIADNGGGVDKRVIDKIFQPFSSTKSHSGMGLGLNIAKKIVQQHNGTINTYNHEDGAVFEIVL